MFMHVSYWVVNIHDEEEAAQIMKMSSKYNLVALHKIGIYEDIRQDELFLKGRWIDMVRFTRELKKSRTKKK